MENPITRTRATDDGLPRERPVRDLAFLSTDLGRLCLRVEVNERDVLYTHVGEHPTIPVGAAVVITELREGDVPLAAVYQSVLTADRGEGYAEIYYEDAVPVIRVDRNDARWALDAVHDSDDLVNPEIVRKRNQRLDRIVARNKDSGSERKRTAAADAERAKHPKDKLDRANPMAAAMANWGAAVQLDKELHIALKADERVSKSRVAIVRLLASVWKSFHDADVELGSMERWWKPGRRRPLPFSQARRLAERAARIEAELALITAAPYGQMPLLAQLREEIDSLVEALNDKGRYRDAFPLLQCARRTAAKLILHRVIAQMLVTAGKVRRFKKPITAAQRREYVAAADRANTQIVAAIMDEPGRSVFLSRLQGRLEEAKQVGLEDEFDAERAYELLGDASNLYLERPTN